MNNKMTFNEFCKQFITDREDEHPLSCYRYPLSAIEEKYKEYVSSK